MFVLQQLGVIFGATPVSLSAAIIMKVETFDTVRQIAQMFVTDCVTENDW